MRPLLTAALIAAIPPVAVLLAANPTPNASYGAVAVQTTPTLIGAPLNAREGVAAFNLGAATIYCGFDASVTTATGFPVPASGSLSLALGYNSSTSKKPVYCVAAAAQTSPADTRWAEVL